MTDAPKFLKPSEIGDDVKRRIATQVWSVFTFNDPRPSMEDVSREVAAIFADPEVDKKVPVFPLHPQTRAVFIGNHVDALAQKVIKRFGNSAPPEAPPEEPAEEPGAAPPADPVLTLEETPDEGYRPDFRAVPRVPRKP
jgi:hypothetical protein